MQCNVFGESNIKVVVPIETRWNSDYLMIKMALRIRRSLTFISNIIIGENKTQDNLTEFNNEDWDILELIVELLEPFYQGNIIVMCLWNFRKLIIRSGGM